MEDDHGTSYYYRGASEYNYLKFAGFYWRIIRVNGDGTLRIIYDGTTPHRNGEASEDRVALKNITWNNTNNNDAKYVGYMYGGLNGEASTSKEQAQSNETSSNIKTQLENWYNTNIPISYRNVIADNIFCNDKSIVEGEGYGENTTYYGAYSRLISTKKPNFKCTQDNDKFTTNATVGNGKLLNPVGVITADELSAGGSVINITNHNHYLYKGIWYWSLSPSNFSSSSQSTFSSYAVMLYGDKSGSLGITYTSQPGSLAPVLNLTKEYAKSLIGDGSIINPYRENGVEP